LAFAGFLGLAGRTLQQRWLGVDQGTREMVGLARFPGFDTPMRTVSILGDQAGLILLIALASLLVWQYSRRWAAVAVGIPQGSEVLVPD
jgi:hypothetical protein